MTMIETQKKRRRQSSEPERIHSTNEPRYKDVKSLIFLPKINEVIERPEEEAKIFFFC